MSDTENLSKRKRKAKESWKTSKKTKTTSNEAEELPINPLSGAVKIIRPERKQTSSDPADEKVKTEGDAKKKETAKKYILFIGNLSYTTTADRLKAHFEASGVTPTAVRLRTDPKTSVSKGCAFIDFENSQDHFKALQLHLSNLDKRKINVELTAGGGGSGRARKAKLYKKNEKLTKERAGIIKTNRDKAAKKSHPAVQSNSRGKKNANLTSVNPARRQQIA